MPEDEEPRLIAERRRKLERVVSSGRLGYPYRFPDAVPTATVAAAAGALDPGAEDPSRTFAVAGRLGPVRQHGKSAFLDLHDLDGHLQLFARVDELGDAGYEAMLAPGARVPAGMKDELVADARRLEAAGAALLDFTNSGPVAGPEVTRAVGIPVIGGAGGGPWLDGRVRLAQTAIGSAAKTIGSTPDSYTHVAQAAFDAFTALAADARAGRHIKGDGKS